MHLDNAFITRLRPNLLRFLRARNQSREDSDDLAQDVLLRVWRRGIEFDTEKQCFAYIYTAARNALASHVGRSGPVHEEFLDCPSLAPDPGAQFLAYEIEQIVRIELGRFDDRLCAFIDPDQQPPSYAETAAALGCSEGALRTAVSRCRKELRERIRKQLAAWNGAISCAHSPAPPPTPRKVPA